jgi:DNA-binding transcriptional LysR family regulator
MLRAVQDAVGIGHFSEDLVAPLIKAGKLVRLLEDWSLRQPGWFLYYTSRRQIPTPLRVLVDFLKHDLRVADSGQRAK